MLFYGGLEYEGFGEYEGLGANYSLSGRQLPTASTPLSLLSSSGTMLFDGTNGIFRDGDGDKITCRVKPAEEEEVANSAQSSSQGAFANANAAAVVTAGTGATIKTDIKSEKEEEAIKNIAEQGAVALALASPRRASTR